MWWYHGLFPPCMLYYSKVVTKTTFLRVAYWNISNKNPFLFWWIYPFNFQNFTVLLFITVRDLNYSSLPYWLFNFDPNYIIQRDYLLISFQNIIITIITSYGKVVKTHAFFCINSFYSMFSHFSLHMSISNALVCTNNSRVFQLCLWLKCSIRIFFHH